MLSPVTRLQIQVGFEATKSSDLYKRLLEVDSKNPGGYTDRGRLLSVVTPLSVPGRLLGSTYGLESYLKLIREQREA